MLTRRTNRVLRSCAETEQLEWEEAQADGGPAPRRRGGETKLLLMEDGGSTEGPRWNLAGDAFVVEQFCLPVAPLFDCPGVFVLVLIFCRGTNSSCGTSSRLPPQLLGVKSLILYGVAVSAAPAESLCMALEMLLIASSLPCIAQCISSRTRCKEYAISCLICCCNVIKSAVVAMPACCYVMRLLLLLLRISRASK